MPTYTFVLADGGEFRMHRHGCSNAQKSKHSETVITAENVKSAIREFKQSLFEDACGVGNFEDADPELQEDALSFCSYDPIVLPCVKVPTISKTTKENAT